MPFQKGQSGNPLGRPTTNAWAEILRNVGEEIEPKSKKKFRELVSRRLWIECVNGNVNAMRELFNRMDGLPQAFIDHTTDGEKLEIFFHSSLKQDEKK